MSLGQALSIEQMPDSVHYNQITSSEMKSYFEKGEMKMTEAIGNVQTVYYMTNDKDSSLVGLRLIWRPIPCVCIWEQPESWIDLDPRSLPVRCIRLPRFRQPKYKLPNFAWFEDLRPTDKNDIFVWRGKSSGTELKSIKRHEAPLESRKKEPLKEDKEKAEAETASEKTAKVAPKVTKKNKRKIKKRYHDE